MPRWLRGSWGRLSVALLLSLLVHFWLAGGLDFVMPEREIADTIMVRLVESPPTKPALPVANDATNRPKPPRPAPPKPQPAPRPAPQPEPETAPMQQATPIPPPVPQPTPEEPPQEITRPPETPAMEQIPYTFPEEEKLPPPPRHVEISFQITRKGGVAGVERHRYDVAEDGSYRLQSVIEPKGLISLVVSELTQKSEGMVTEQGLRPSSYTYQYGHKEDKSRHASFDWQARQITMDSGGKQRTAELQDGAQDMLSFMYQFMFVPPLQDTRLAVTNGRKFKVYDYIFYGEETIETKFGKLQAWHIGRGNDGEDKTELWLAPEHHFLPVRVRITEKDGTVTESTVTSIKLE